MEIKENFVTFLWIERGICKSDICENDIKRYVKVLGSDDKAQLTIMDEYDECVEVFSLSDGFNWYLVSECLDEIDSETAGFELHIQKSSTSEIKYLGISNFALIDLPSNIKICSCIYFATSRPTSPSTCFLGFLGVSKISILLILSIR